MLIPLTHENMEARRWPIVTTVLVVVNLLFFLFVSLGQREAAQAAAESQRDVVQYWQEHPELKNPPSLEAMGVSKPRALGDGDRQADPEQQAELDQRAERLVAALRASPYRTWGYVPKENNLLGLVTSQFVHGGIMHLVFNMWFMWLCACNLEDRWGRLIFLPMYLVAGIVAALVQRATNPESIVPLIGASGAVAGAMGAFLVAFARTRIRFLYWIFLRPGTFTAPAWVMLPLWLAGEVFWALMLPPGSDGTAHAAHVGGFFFGVVFAGVLVLTGIDRRLDAAVESKVTTAQDPELAQAGALIDQNRMAEAITALEAYLGRAPSSLDGHLELLRAATAVRDPRRMGMVYGRLVELYVRAGALDAAAAMLLEAAQHGLGTSIPMRTQSELASRLVAASAIDLATGVYASMLQRGITDLVTTRAAITYAKLLLGANRHLEADPVIEALEASNPVPELRAEIAALRAQVRGRSVAL